MAKIKISHDNPRSSQGSSWTPGGVKGVPLTSIPRFEKSLNLEQETQVEGFWDNPDKAQKHLKKSSAGRRTGQRPMTTLQPVVEDLQVLYDFSKDGEADRRRSRQAVRTSPGRHIEELEFRNMLSAMKKTDSVPFCRSRREQVERKAATGPPCCCACTSCGPKKTISK